jgi:hypothetical protein
MEQTGSTHFSSRQFYFRLQTKSRTTVISIVSKIFGYSAQSVILYALNKGISNYTKLKLVRSNDCPQVCK